MEKILTRIKNAITGLLKTLDPETDVFYEEIKGTGKEEGLLEPETYYFVDIIPSAFKTIDKIFTDVGILIDIAYHEKNESNTAYLIKGAEIDANVRPVFCFENRKITVNDASIKIVDHVLHYSFNLRFRQSREQTEGFERMGKLHAVVRKGGI